MHKTPSLLVATVFAALTVAVWAYANRSTPEPQWPAKVRGFSFQPFQKHQDAVAGDLPTAEEIDRDLTVLTGKTQAVRSYSVLGTLGEIPALAARHGLSVNIGAWLGSDRIRNEREIERAIQLANSHKNVTRVIIGNEVVLRGDLPVGDLVAHLDRVRAATSQPVSTAEPWHVWIANPELADHVDYIAVHMLPYWEGVAVETAVDYIAGKMDLLERRFPGKPIVIGEVGWPSEGRTRESAVASQANQALFLRRFLERAAQQGYTYYLMEAFDQPWKEQSEGAVGAYWGIYDADREQKFEFHAPIVRIPQWHVLAAASVIAAATLLWLFFFHSATLRNRGRSFLAIVVYATATLVVWILYDMSQQYVTVTSVLVSAVLLVGMVGVIAVLLAEAHEWAEAHWVTGHGRLFRTDRGAGQLAAPRVDPCACLQRAAGHADRDARCARPPRLPGLRGPGHRQQHQGRGGVASGGGSLCTARAALPLLPRGPARRLQGRSAQLRAAPDCARRRSRRGDRRRLYREAGAGCATWCRVRERAHRRRPGAAGLPRRGRKRLQGHVLRGVPRLLPHRHGHPQRAQRHHPARHHDHGASVAARAAAAGPSGASPRMPNSVCVCSKRATKPPTCR